MLLAADHEVYVLDDLSTGRLENVEHLLDDRRFHLVVDSVLHHAVVNELVHKCDQVYHLAAAVGVQLIVERPVETITTNIRGTEIVLELCARFDKRVLISSTSEVYGDRKEPVALRENDQRVYGPTTVNRWAYAASKEVDEFLALAWNRESGLDVVIARLFNTVGPRQTGRYGMVVPRFLTSALTGTPIQVYGTGEQTRCFCDVSDAVQALVTLMDDPRTSGGIFNVGNPRSISMNQLAELIRNRYDARSKIVHVPYGEVYGPDFEDMLHRMPSIARITEVVGWTPRITLEQTLDRIVAERRPVLDKQLA